MIYEEKKPLPDFIIDWNSIGTIYVGENVQGTGFVYYRKNIVVTCSHVIKDALNIFYSPFNDPHKKVRLTLKKNLLDQDFAILETSDQNIEISQLAMKPTGTGPGIGGELVLNSSVITSKGTELYKKNQKLTLLSFMAMLFKVIAVLPFLTA